MRADVSPGENPIADVLVLVLSAGIALRDWRAAGILEREALLYHRLARRYRRMVVVSEGGAEDGPLAAGLAPPGVAAPELICNDRGLERAAFIAELPGRIREQMASFGPSPLRTAVIKTNQMDAADAALHIARGLREGGVRVGLVARGGYPWSRFVAWEAGAESARAAEAAAAEGELCRGADVVIGTTERMLDELRWRYGLAGDRTVCVPNYVPHEARPGDGRREPRSVLFAGRLAAQKRVDLLIDAVALLAGGARLTIVGSGEQEAALRARARERGVHAEFLPRMPQSELLERMRGCAAYAQASAYEGHPKALLEAMACGARVVVADAPGLSDVVEAGITGLVARPTAESLARALARILADSDLAAELGRNAAAGAEAWRVDPVAELEAAAHELAISRAGESAAGPPGVVRWGPELLHADAETAAAAWARSLHGYARRLPAQRRARFAAAVEMPVYHVVDWAALETAGGVHPKHRLTGYHDFFVERVHPGERVLDLGCGYAELARSIAVRARADVTGMDWSEANVAQARAMIEREGLAGRLHIVRGDITRMRAAGPDGSPAFDVVVLSNVLEHLRDRPELLARYIEWYSPRALLIRVPAFDRNWQTAWKRELGVDYRCDDTHETEYTEASLRAELAEAGLEVRELIIRWGEYWACAEPIAAVDRSTQRRGAAGGTFAFAPTETSALGARHDTAQGEYTDRESKAAYIAREYAAVLGGSVLDVGCGEGLLRRHVPRTDLYVGLDAGPAADIVADLEGGVLPFADRSFDAVVCTDVLEHLEAAHAVFDECCRVSRSRVVISLPNPVRNFITELFAGSGGRMKYYGLPADKPADRHRWFFGFEEAEAFIRARALRNGFELERLDSTHDGCCYWLNGKGQDVLDHANIKRGTLWAVLIRRDRRENSR